MRKSDQKHKPDTKNLVLRNKTWHVCAMVRGVIIRQSLHTSELGKAQALRDAILLPLRAHRDERQLLASVKRQLDGLEAEEERLRQQKGVQLQKVWGKFITDPTRKTCSDQTLREHLKNWTDFLLWLQKHHPDVRWTRQVTRAVCTEWAGDKLASVRTVNTYNHAISSVRYVLTSICAIDEGFANPMQNIHKRPAPDCIGKEPFSPDELIAIFHSKDAEFVRLCAIGLYTTLRLGSARLLTWDMFSADLTHLTAVHHKTGADASQVVAPELRELLAKVPPEDRHGFLCPHYASMSKSRAALDVQQHLQDVGIQTHHEVEGLNGQVRRACVKGYHSFRHTAITLALRNGATVQQVKRLAGHASEAMQMRYTHFGAEDAGKASALIGKFW